MGEGDNLELVILVVVLVLLEREIILCKRVLIVTHGSLGEGDNPMKETILAIACILGEGGNPEKEGLVITGLS